MCNECARQMEADCSIVTGGRAMQVRIVTQSQVVACVKSHCRMRVIERRFKRR
ncbi:MAG: hypothetical protein ABI977_35375 [Acidobacteriota bacterium]